MLSHIVTVEFTVSPEPAPLSLHDDDVDRPQSGEEAAVEVVQAALATVANMVNYSPGTDALLSHLTNFVVRRVD